jgi:WD40 repeat protein
MALALVLVAGTAIASVLWLRAEEARRQARGEADRNGRLLHAADVNLAQTALRERRFDQADALLRATRPAPGKPDLRGWEWHYLWRTLHKERRSMTAPGGACLSADGARLVVIEKRCISVLNTADGRVLLSRPLGPGANSWHPLIALSPDGSHLATARVDEAAVTELDTGRNYPPVTVAGDVVALALGKDRLVLGVLRDRKLGGDVVDPVRPLDYEVRDAATGRLLHTVAVGGFKEFGAHAAALSADGRLLAVLAGEEVSVWDLATAVKRYAVSRRSSVDRDPFPAFRAEAVLDPVGKYLAVLGGNGRTVHLHDLAGGQRLRTLDDFPEPVVALCFGPGSRLAVAQEGGTVTVVDPADRKAPQEFYRPNGEVEDVAFRADGTLFSLGGDGVLEWDTHRPDRVRLPRLEGEVGPLSELALSPDGRRLAALAVPLGPAHPYRTRLKVWDVSTGRELLDRPLNAATPTAVLAWSPDGRKLALWQNDGPAVAAFRMPTPAEGVGGVLSTLLLPEQPAFKIHLWDAETGRDGPTLAVRLWRGTPVFSPDGSRLVTSDRQGSLILWDTASGKSTLLDSDINLHAGPVFSPGGQCLLTVERKRAPAADGSKSVRLHQLRLREAATGRVLVSRPLPPDVDRVRAVRFHPGGEQVALLIEGAEDKEGGKRWRAARWAAGDLWQGETFLNVPASKSGDGVGALEFSADGRFLAVGIGRQIWLCTASGHRLRTLPGHAGAVSDLRFTPDGRRLFAGLALATRWQREVKVWDVDTGRELLTLPVRPSLHTMITPLHFDGRRLAVAGWAAPGVPEVEIFDGTPAEER